MRGLSVWCTVSMKKKTHIETTIRWESCDFSCHSTEPTKEAWKPKFWQDDLTFPSMSAALYLWMCGSSLFVELHQERSAPAACAVGLFSLYIAKKYWCGIFFIIIPKNFYLNNIKAILRLSKKKLLCFAFVYSVEPKSDFFVVEFFVFLFFLLRFLKYFPISQLNLSKF